MDGNQGDDTEEEGRQADVGFSQRATVAGAGKCGRRADVGFPQHAAVARAGKFWGERADVRVTQRVTSASASAAPAGGSCTRGKERMRPEPSPPSDVDSQADATGMEQILKELHCIIASQERMHAEVKAEVQQVSTEVTSEAQRVRVEVTAEMQQVCAEVQVWRAELEKTVRTVELNEAQLRTQILGTAAGLVHIEQKWQQEVAQMCAKLEMMQNEQEKKKGNEEERLNALVHERVEEFEQQLSEKEVARLQEHQQSVEEWLAERMCREFERQKRSQREFNKKMAEIVDKLKQESETKVTIVLEMCEQVGEQL